jgi:hypothetical protein
MGHALATLIGTSTYPGASSPAVSGTMAGNITGNWIHVAGKTGATFQFTWTGRGYSDWRCPTSTTPSQTPAPLASR